MINTTREITVNSSENGKLKVQNLWILIVVIGILFRIVLAFYQPHSGKSTPPMFGDFEAQRHWIEVTSNLPISEWYFYDLEYWGLDYPPLTAFHHYLMGKVNGYLNLCDGCFEFMTSRGNQNVSVIMFMRISVILMDLLLYIPVCLLLLKLIFKLRRIMDTTLDTSFGIEIFWMICCPSLMMIDHGHFQYNSIFLGFTIIAIYMLMKYLEENHVIHLSLASMSFVFSISYKQMSLYYSLPFFFFILALTIREPKRFLIVALSVIFSFGLMFGPFILQKNGTEIFLQVIHRMFPFKRGLFEDKVATFWCSTSMFIKWNVLFGEKLVKLSTILTFLFSLPSCIHLLFITMKRSTNSALFLSRIFVTSVTIVSFSFYMFSYQVHEKTILVPLIPSIVLYCLDVKGLRQYVPLLNIVACFSMYPLFIKDKLTLAYYVIQLVSISITFMDFHSLSKISQVVSIFSILGMIGIHILLDYAKPPMRYPDLFTLFCTTFSFIHFVLFFIKAYYVQLFGLRDNSACHEKSN
ncbi:dolichyl pyrophosphate Man9GlcNAc2 alpha-1,3-glucosyltransferase [Naegleria gruberi]|uniref:Alpha-1,3-glucosyltransferase n=1 Tax=Naegleria gruberi TaxID=5762 RepID=D2UZR6_NAEGR|nr:dolichyl pyrophosphate Man9GlcNAc2 alpha-1,3-glucosyltransferase [Naegleria gruberi]EFC49982.1 dolichyl pyrophosphate Man9GlcNAc2 alpha-1,3-glucosyltransferase [Naegleria gruberi]|eukprot:XP_002682726.1 dolichyl pyrophosphate Man9GlcNAc2 alpha-1,3-glucosyltransferase [Naegleria gruberi strain NEG-M]